MLWKLICALKLELVHVPLVYRYFKDILYFAEFFFKLFFAHFRSDKVFVWCVPQVSHSANTDKGQVCNGTSNTSDITTPNHWE